MIIYRDAKPSPSQAALPIQPLYASSYYEFPDPITTNLLNSTRIAQVKLALGTTYEASIMDGVRIHDLAIRAAAMGVISAAAESDLRSEEGKRKILEKIRDAANGVLRSKGWFPGIESAHFTSIYMQ